MTATGAEAAAGTGLWLVSTRGLTPEKETERCAVLVWAGSPDVRWDGGFAEPSARARVGLDDATVGTTRSPSRGRNEKETEKSAGRAGMSMCAPAAGRGRSKSARETEYRVSTSSRSHMAVWKLMEARTMPEWPGGR